MQTRIDQVALSSQPESGEIIQPVEPSAIVILLIGLGAMAFFMIQEFSGQEAFRVKPRARLARARHREMTREVAKIRKDKRLAKAVGFSANDPSDAVAELLVRLDELDALTPIDHEVDAACRMGRRRDINAYKKVKRYVGTVDRCYNHTWRPQIYRQVVAFREERRWEKAQAQREKAQVQVEKEKAANRERAAQILNEPLRDRGRELVDARVEHVLIAEEFGAIRTDISQRIHHIGLEDMTLDPTATFVSAYGRMTDLNPGADDSSLDPASDEAEQYVSAVRNCRTAWNTALAAAVVTPRQDLHVTIRDAAAQAETRFLRGSGAGRTSHEQRTAKEKAQQILDRVTPLRLRQMEAGPVRLELTVSHDSSVTPVA